jgi:tetratricopeptide (TPR) repeat protein
MKTAFLLVAALASFARAGVPAQAKQKFDSGDYTGAAAGFSEALKASPDDAALHYDLGNALFRAGKLGPAIASYQRAFDLWPRGGDIRFNLGFALRRAGEELVPPGVPPVMFTLFYWLSARELAGLHWLFCWLALLTATAWLLRQELRERLFTPALALACLWAVFGGWWGLRAWLEPNERGVIVRATGEVRSGPGENFPVTVTAPEGRRVEILSEQGAWLEIGILKEGAKGWIAADSVEKI